MRFLIRHYIEDFEFVAFYPYIREKTGYRYNLV